MFRTPTCGLRRSTGTVVLSGAISHQHSKRWHRTTWLDFITSKSTTPSLFGSGKWINLPPCFVTMRRKYLSLSQISAKPFRCRSVSSSFGCSGALSSAMAAEGTANGAKDFQSQYHSNNRILWSEVFASSWKFIKFILKHLVHLLELHSNMVQGGGIAPPKSEWNALSLRWQGWLKWTPFFLIQPGSSPEMFQRSVPGNIVFR